MDDRHALIITMILMVVFVCVIFFLYRIMRKKSLIREQKGLALTAESLTQALPLPDTHYTFLFSVLVNGKAFSNTHFIVKDSANKQIATIHVLRAQYPVMRRIEYQGKIYECTDTMNKLRSKIDLHEQGTTHTLLHMERKVLNETYSVNGEVKYVNGDFNPKGSMIKIGTRSAGFVRKLRQPLDIDGLMIATDKNVPVLDQLFILALTYRFT